LGIFLNGVGYGKWMKEVFIASKGSRAFDLIQVELPGQLKITTQKDHVSGKLS